MRVLRRGVREAAWLALLFVPLATPAAAGPRTVAVLLFDGFAPAAVSAWDTPALDRMGREGAFTHEFEPPFPSVSLTGGVTISTGCWPERHGIVANVFIDPERGRYDHGTDADWLTGCEHLHQVAERQGVASAALAWYGARAGGRPLATHVEPPGRVCETSPEPRDVERAERLVRLLQLPPERRPRLLLAYFCGPDDALHYTGFESEQTRRAVEQSDGIVRRVIEAVESLPDASDVTVVVTTDHGMQEVSHVVNIQRILYAHDIDAEPVSGGTTSFLYFDDEAGVEEAARELASYDEFEVLRRDALPGYARLGTGPRVAPLIVSARPPYFIENVSAWPAWLQWLGRWGPEFLWARLSLEATHGYPPGMEGADVYGILYAWGSGIAAVGEVGRVRAVDVHPTVTHLLGIEPGRPVDGSVAAQLLD